jgi:hypothetical protein
MLFGYADAVTTPLQPQANLVRLERTNRSPVAPLPLPDEAHPVSGDDHRITVKSLRRVARA